MRDSGQENIKTKYKILQQWFKKRFSLNYIFNFQGRQCIVLIKQYSIGYNIIPDVEEDKWCWSKSF